MGIFDKRVNYKPFEYPEAMDFVKTINKTFWVHEELDFTADIQDYSVKLSKEDKELVKRALLGIAQLEVNVGTFWNHLYDTFPKPEFNIVGSTFSENECHIEGTEILTTRGWKDFRDLTLEDTVLQYNLERHIYQPVKPKRVICTSYKGSLHTVSKSNMAFKVSPNHRFYFYSKNNEFREKKIKDISKFTGQQLPVTGLLEKKGITHLSTLDKLKIMIQADGSKRYWKNKDGEKLERGKANGVSTYEINLKKERKVKRCLSLLKEEGLTYREYQVNRKGYKKIEIDFPYDEISYKTFDWVNLEDKSDTWCKEFVEELAEWDGIRLDGKGNSKNCLIKYTNTNKSCIDIAQMVGLGAGYRCHISTRKDNRKESFNDVYVLSFTKSNPTISFQANIVKEDYEGNIYCAEVPSGCIVTRCDNKVLISGNSRHAEAYSRLLEVLSLEEEFEKIEQYPAFKEKLDTVEEIFESQKDDFLKLLYFTMIVENVTLFAQFANILSYTRFTGSMKNIANVVQWTSLDEIQHIHFGIYLINKLIEEGYIVDEKELKESIKKYIDVELKFMDWVYEYSENKFFTREDIHNYIKYRTDDALIRLGFSKLYNTTEKDNMVWFEEEIYANTLDDFFAKRPVDYTKKDKSFTEEDLF